MSIIDELGGLICALPDRYRIEGGMLVAEVASKNGEIRDHVVANAVGVAALVIDDVTGEFGREVAFVSRGNTISRSVIWDRDFSNPSKITSQLAAKGLWVEASGLSARLLVSYLNDCEPDTDKSYVERTGWLRDQRGFVLGARVIGAADGTTIANPPNLGWQQSCDCDIGDWKASVGRFCGGNPMMLFAVCLATAGPVFRLIGQAAAGAHIFWHSSSGKTTIARVAASVYGPGSANFGGFISTWNATSNALGEILAIRNDTVLVLDEIGQASRKAVSEIAYAAANGRGRSRARSNGGLRSESAWSVPVLSTGEVSVADFCSGNPFELNDGQAVRLMSIPLKHADEDREPFRNLHGHKSAASFADAISTATESTYGSVANLWLNELCSDPVHWATELRRERDRIVAEWSTEARTGVERRAVAFYALLASVGRALSRLSVLDISEDEAEEAIQEVYRLWLSDQRCSSTSTMDAILLRLYDMIVDPESGRFPNIRSKSEVLHGERWGVRDGDIVWFYTKKFSDGVLEGKAATAVYANLIKRGVILPRKDNETTWPKRFSANGHQIRCVKIDVCALADAVGMSDCTECIVVDAENETASVFTRERLAKIRSRNNRRGMTLDRGA